MYTVFSISHSLCAYIMADSHISAENNSSWTLFCWKLMQIPFTHILVLSLPDLLCAKILNDCNFVISKKWQATYIKSDIFGEI